VNLIDLVGVAMHRDESVAAHYQRTYSLGLLSNGREDWLRMVSLRLKKPCPFLEDDLCSIYPVRPLPCALFPEYLVGEGTFEVNAGKEHCRDYLCFRHPLPLSPDRARVVAKLKRMWERENLVSSFYLFKHGSCHVDFSNLIKELSDKATGPRETELAKRPEPVRIIPNQELERFFLKHMARHEPFSEVREKIIHLDNLEEQVRFLHFLQDDLLVKKLKQADRTLVHRFVKGRLQAKRRSLTPREYEFYG
jgi:Fe-S-cluster containining protein